MDLFTAAILGLVQALTEFLPVSSSGHLVLSQALLGVDMGHGAAFEVAVHFGTLLSVTLVFRKDIWLLGTATLSVVRAPQRLAALMTQSRDVRMGVNIVLGCLPAGIVGLAFKDELETAFDNVLLVCGALIFTGLLLLATRFFPKGVASVSIIDAFLIGLAQAFAIIPGISRSGSTIAVAMMRGIEAEEAARYSFLLSLPVIAGATLLKLSDFAEAPPPADLINALALGAFIAFVAGVIALVLLLAVVRKGGFAHFGWYCLAVGSAGFFSGQF